MNFKLLFKKIQNNIRCRKIMKDYGKEIQCRIDGLKAVYDQTLSGITVGCKCGKAIDEKLWDADLGWYHFVDCQKCGYYWEGPMNG